MKATMVMLATIVLAGLSHAEFRTWTNADGKTAELNLLKVEEVDGQKVGEFTLRNGRKVKLPAASLIAADAQLLRGWKPDGEAADAAQASVFMPLLDGDLLQLDGKSLKRLKDFKEPTKYYLFYYTASWCGPCQQFTPSLVDFYKKHKNDEFEVVLITSDGSEEAMENDANAKQMPWPHLELGEVSKFREKFQHPGRGIPNLVLCDLDENLIKTSYVGDQYVGPSSVMNHLGTLLSK